jgi:hypothetical protein
MKIFSPARNKIANTHAEGSHHVDRIEELIFVLASQEVRSREHIARCQHSCKICGKKAKFFRSYSHVPYKSLNQGRAIFIPDAAQTVSM